MPLYTRIPSTNWTGDIISLWTGGLDYCYIQCASNSLCNGWVTSGTGCYLLKNMNTATYPLISTPLHTTFVVSTLQRLAVLSVRRYIQYAGSVFNWNAVVSQEAAANSCQLICNSVVGCNGYSTNVQPTPNVCHFFPVNATWVDPPATGNAFVARVSGVRQYYSVSGASFGSGIGFVGNKTDCAAFCDAIGSCVGFTFDGMNNCGTFFYFTFI